MNNTELFKCEVNKFDDFYFTSDRDYFEIAKEVGYEFENGHSSAYEVSQYIYSEIKNKLEGDDLKLKEFECIRTQLLVEYFIDVRNDKYLRFIEVIRDATRGLESFIKIGDNWVDVFRLAAAHRCLQIFDPLANVENIHQKERAVANSIKYFESKGFKVNFENGSVFISKEEHKRIGIAIDVRFKRLGLVGLNAVMSGLRNLFNASANRYFFQGISNEPLVPWGYLFRMSLKYMHERKRKVGDKKDFLDLFDLAHNYATVLGLQEYSQYESMFQRPDTILDKVQKIVLSDQVYSVLQTDLNHIVELIKFIFSRVEVDESSMPWSFNDYIGVLEAISSLHNNKYPISFSASDLFYRMNGKCSLDVVNRVLLDMSHNVGGINSDYLTPFDSVRCNHNLKPLVNLGNSIFIFLDSMFFSFGFYEIISSEYRKLGVKDVCVGDLLEDFIANKFTSSGISFLAREKYKINKAKQRLFSTNRDKGECDFIVETDEVIIFIEVKKKILTRAAQAGDVAKISKDLISSFVKSQTQANWHEIMLKNEGVINFESGKSIELKGREIEKISLSMFDYMALHDGVLIHQVMSNLIGRELISSEESDRSELNEVNKVLSELTGQYKLPELKTYFDNKSYFFNCRFFNLFHFIQILDKSSNVKDFKKAIWANRHLSTGEKDWFKEMHYLKNLESEAAKAKT